jgi:UDP-N-acetylenolpyruvoylglucosamine reductase
MRISDPNLIGAIGALGVEYKPGVSLAAKTSLEIGGTSDVLLIRVHESLPELIHLLKLADMPHRFLGGGSNVLLPDGELPWVILQLARHEPDMRFEGNCVMVDCAADLDRSEARYA